MGDLTGKLIANTYKDLLQIDSSATNEGLDGTLRAIQDGSGNNSSLKISETSAAFTGNVSITGNLNVGSSFTVGAVETGVLSATTIRGSTVSVTNITTDTLTAETLTFQDVSVSSLRTGNLTVTNNVTATAYYGDGSNLTGIASDTRIAAVSALTVVNQTSIAANTSLIVINQTSIAANASAVVALSATLETRIAAVSALTAVNKTSIAANASAVVALSATLETRIAAVSVLTATNKTSIAANASAVVALSATLETRIAAVSVLTATNKTSIAANASAVVALSATLETRIAAVSVLTATNKTSIAANASAVVALSATLETRIAAVSVLTATNKTSITANASTIVALSATLESRIAALSATVATSISNYLPLTGGSLTGVVTITTGDNNPQLVLKSTDADALSGPLIELFRDSSSPANDDLTGRISFQAEDSGSNKVTYSRINSYIDDVTDVSVTGKIEIATNQIGSFKSRIMFDETEAVINDDGVDYDFRVESDTVANALFVQGSSGNVGIGTSLPSKQLHQIRTGSASDLPTLSIETGFITQSTNATASSQNISIMSGNIGEGRLFFGDTDDEDVGNIVYNHNSNYMTFDTAANERMRIDSSGNLLVGTTDDVVWNNNTDTSADNGHNLRDDGRAGFSYYAATANSNATANINRTNSDGDLIRLFRSGTTVGSLGTINSDLTIGTGDVGFRFRDGSNDILPFDIGSNSATDDLASFGSGTNRFKDLYLSGGVYIGGTGAANLLDDYEEGTYTVQLFDASSGGNASSSSVTGTYTKIGNLVTVRFDALNNINTTGMTGANDLHFSLPFSASSTGRSAGSVNFDNLDFATGRTMIVPLVFDNASRGQFHTSGNNVTDQITEVQDINSGSTDIHTFTLTYATA